MYLYSLLELINEHAIIRRRQLHLREQVARDAQEERDVVPLFKHG